MYVYKFICHALFLFLSHGQQTNTQKGRLKKSKGNSNVHIERRDTVARLASYARSLNPIARQRLALQGKAENGCYGNLPQTNIMKAVILLRTILRATVYATFLGLIAGRMCSPNIKLK
jgi:hypothetical protein